MDCYSGKTYNPGYDGRGNVTHLVDAANLWLAAEFEYSPFGLLIRATGDTSASPFRYQTKWAMDYRRQAISETYWPTDLYDYGLRYYNASLGRFQNRDPIGEAGGNNLYAFAGNDPINKWDYMGLSCAETCASQQDADAREACVKNCMSRKVAEARQELEAIAEGNGTGKAAMLVDGDWVSYNSGLFFTGNSETGEMTVWAFSELKDAANLAAGQAAEQQDSGFAPQGPQNGSRLGNWFRNHVPFVGWTFGSVGDILSGHIENGIASFVDVVVHDVAAMAIGVVSEPIMIDRRLYNVGRAVANRDWTGSDGLTGALSRLGSEVLIPNYGWYGGGTWGYQSGNTSTPLNWVDANSYSHDRGFIDSRQWVNNNLGVPQPPWRAAGLFGMAYSVLGSAPFYLYNTVAE